MSVTMEDIQESLNGLDSSVKKVMRRKVKLEALYRAVKVVVGSGRIISKSNPVTDDDWLSIINALAEVGSEE